MGRLLARRRRVIQAGDDRRRYAGATTGSTRTASSTCTSGTSRSRSTPLPTATSAASTARRCSLARSTYDEMRPGCYEPEGRVSTTSHSPASTARWPSRPSRASAGRPSWRATISSSGLECVRAYNDWMIEEWCGDSGGRLIPLCLMPLWDVDLAVAEVERNAARGARARLLQRDPDAPRSAEHPHRILGSALRGVRGDAHDAVHAHRIVVEDAGRVARRAAVDRHHAVVQQLDGVAGRLPVLGRARAVSRARSSRTRRARSAGSRTRSSGPTTPGSTTRTGRARRRRSRSRRLPTTAAGSSAASPTTSTAWRPSPQVGEDNICFETDYPHTDTTWPFTSEEVERMTASLTDEPALQGPAGQRDPPARPRPRLTPSSGRSPATPWARQPAACRTR